MVFFPNSKIELWEYCEDDSIPNFFGETTASYTLVGVYDGDFQNMSPKDSLQEYGKILEDTFKVYFDVNVPVTDTMILRKVDEPYTYTINGSPQKYRNVLPHIKVNLQRQRKPLQLD